MPRCSLPHSILSVVWRAMVVVVSIRGGVSADEFARLQQEFEATHSSLLQKYCLDCHSAAEPQGELDLERFRSVADIRADVVPWQRVVEMLDDREMPPADAASQPTDAERSAIRNWVRAVLDADATANAGDPGPVVLRRLNNAEYTWSIQDLTGVALEPAKEFPVDSAAGEGFTNVGNALVMSPALVQKYLTASRDIAAHAMLLSHGIEFSPSTTSRDWTDEKLAAIRKLYSRYSDSSGGTAVNLQGVTFETNGGGRLPIERYLLATINHRTELTAGTISIAGVAAREGLSEKYLSLLWNSLTDSSPSLLLDPLRADWRDAGIDDVGQLAARIAVWQQALWRFTTVGHIGKRDGPAAWQVVAQPVSERQPVRLALPARADDGTITLYLSAADAGDGNQHDFAVWENPRFSRPGQPDLLLRDVRRAAGELSARRDDVIVTTAKCLSAAAVVAALEETDDSDNAIARVAAEHQVDSGILASWCSYLGIGSGATVLTGHMTQPMERAESYDFVKGWVGADALSVVANSSDQFVRIPGDLQPHSVAVHPAPSLRVAIGWRSPVETTVSVTGRVQRAHAGCGNGVAWRLELRRGRTRQRLAEGVADDGAADIIGGLEHVHVKTGDIISLVISPRDGNHSCDLTAVDLDLAATDHRWNLAADICPDILAGNPHADRFGNADVWHFYSEQDSGSSGDSIIPAGSLLARWQAATDPTEQQSLAAQIQALLSTGPGDRAVDSPDAVLVRQLTSLSGPLFAALRNELLAKPELPRPDRDASAIPSASALHEFGLNASAFGRHPDGSALGAADLCVLAPAMVRVVVPADLVEGCEFVTSGVLHRPSGLEGSVQMQVLSSPPDAATGLTASATRSQDERATWSSSDVRVTHDVPVIVCPGSGAEARLLAEFDQFRQLFPAALCYTRIVPVDEVVTLTLFYREDDQLRRLMLTDDEARELDQLWDDLHTVSRSPLALVDAYEQLWQFATQDADPSAFTPMKDGIMQRAADFQRRLREAEPVHVQSVLDFAARAWRRPLTSTEADGLRSLYDEWRRDGLDHETAVRTLLARVLVTPAFLYRIEQAPSGASPAPVTDWELATRLSYFLTSSLPDNDLRQVAADGRLHDPSVLVAQTRRLLASPASRRLAVEFGCQWLHIREFDQFDEKSEQHFPEFNGLRADLYEEAIRFFEDFFRNDRPVMSLLKSDSVFVNSRLAEFYGLPPVEGDEWKMIDGAASASRGGILTLGATLAKQSGASRTSPILRGNWVSEFLLGDKLPRPPKDVPVLPEEAPSEMTERQLIERHSSDAACAKCHQRIDGFGFAMEQFDAIGRLRTVDAHGHALDVRAVLPDGTTVVGLAGLRDYLAGPRRADFQRTFSRRLLGYALGRSVQLSDEPLLSEILTALESGDDRVGAVIERIVLSPQFRMTRGADDPRSATSDAAE